MGKNVIFGHWEFVLLSFLIMTKCHSMEILCRKYSQELNEEILYYRGRDLRIVKIFLNKCSQSNLKKELLLIKF